MKFTRAVPKDIFSVPRHRYVSYMLLLTSDKSYSFHEFLAFHKFREEQLGYKPWTKDSETECAYALIWLIEKGLVKVVDDEYGVH